MRVAFVWFGLFLIGGNAFGQAGAGTITGTVTDPGGAVVASAAVEAKNTETGVLYPVATSTTGNYTISQLPVGTYEISVKVPGFKNYSHSNLELRAAAVLREDGAGEGVRRRLVHHAQHLGPARRREHVDREHRP